MRQKKNAAAERKQNMRYRRYSASSLTDSLRSVVRLRRADSPFSKTLTLLSTEPGDKPGKNMCAKKERTKRPRRRRFFHRLRPPDGLHKTDTFSVHLWEPCGSTMKSASGGETRRGLKIITVSGESLPPAPPRSRHIGYRIPFRLSPLRDTWRFLIAHVFWYLGAT